MEKLKNLEFKIFSHRQDTLDVNIDLPFDISEILPYLNATIKGASYNTKEKTLTFLENDKLVTIYSSKILATGLKDNSEVIKFVEEMQNLINNTYERKDKIQPDYKERKKVDVLSIYNLLPKENCKICGETTCLAFALKFSTGKKEIEECEPLFFGKI